MLKILLIFYALNFNVISMILPFQTDPDIKTISKVLHDLVDEFYINEDIQFNILNKETISSFSREVLNDFLAKSNGKFSTRLIQHKIVKENSFKKLTYSFIIFLNSVSDFENLETIFRVYRHGDEAIKFFILIPNLTYKQLRSSWIYKYYSRMFIAAGGVFHHSYFITNELDTVTLSTVEWFSPYGCNRPYLNKLNTFNKHTMTWITKLKNYEKFLHYYGCRLVMMLPNSDSKGNLYHVSGYSILDPRKLPYFEIKGITPIIFDITAKHHNFLTHYQPALVAVDWLIAASNQEVTMYPINNTIYEPLVFFEILSLYNAHGMRVSNVVANLNVYMVVTPAEKYTPYEKFFLPFDLWTWILFFVTFILTFLVIIIINCFSKSVQNLVYGNKVDTPIWNIVCIFFGVSQMKLPNSNFSRFIWIMFIYFCLIFRTCFQSKFFEFMTSEPRQAPPKTVQDLIDRGYNVYAMDVNQKLASNLYRTERWYAEL